QPSIAAVLAHVAIFECQRMATGANPRVLFQCARAVVRVHELDERTRHQLSARKSKRALPGRVEFLEVAVEVEAAEHVDGNFEKTLFEVTIGWPFCIVVLVQVRRDLLDQLAISYLVRLCSPGRAWDRNLASGTSPLYRNMTSAAPYSLARASVPGKQLFTGHTVAIER